MFLLAGARTPFLMYRTIETMEHLSPQAHRTLDLALWLLLLPPLVCAAASLRTKGISAQVLALILVALAEGAWLFVNAGFPGTWRFDVAAAGEDREVSLPKPYSKWSGVELRLLPRDGPAPVWHVGIAFASGRLTEIGPKDVTNGVARIEGDDEDGATLRFSGGQGFNVVAFEDNHAWKDLRVGWLLRDAARPWVLSAGGLLALALIGVAIGRTRMT